MLRTTLAGLRAHLPRMLLTALAITLGVAFVSGTFVLTDTMRAGFDRQFTASADRVSLAVLPKDPGTLLKESLLARLRNLPGVQDAQGVVRGDAPLIGKDGRAYGDVPTLGLSISTGGLQRYQRASGHLPGTPVEVVLDRTTAKRTGYKIGDTVKVLDRDGTARAFTVAGLMDFGVDQEIGARGAVGFTAGSAARMTGRNGFMEIDVKAAPKTAEESLRAAVADAAGGTADVLTSRRLAERMSRASGVDTDRFGLFFLAFALVALFVAALVIYNTFTILIAQRIREMAILRCLGATRGQVFRGVLIEALVVGFVASALGVLAGIGLGAGGAAILATRVSSPGPLTVSPVPVVAGLPAGMLVTLVAALSPARAATRVAPVAALRTQVEGPVRGRASIVRIVVGAVVGSAGAALALAALAVTPGQGPFLVVLVSGIMMSLGLVAVSPLLVRWLAGLIGWLPARFLGVPGALARENSRRNPKRAAITTVALTVGVTLITMFSVALASSQATLDAKLARQFPVDIRLSTQIDSERLIPAQVAGDLRRRPQFGDVTEVREATGRLSGHRVGVATITPGHAIEPTMVAGSFTGLGPGSVALAKDQARILGVGIGRDLSLTGEGGALPLKVTAIFDDDSAIPSVVITAADFLRAFGPKDDTTIDLVLRKGVSVDEGRTIVDEVTRGYPTIRVSSAADIRAQYARAFDQLFVLVGTLLALAIVISLFGIANTLTLSVVERTRESALLRALGLTRRGLRRTLSLEALIIAVIGALIGVVMGTASGWMALASVTRGAVFGFPVPRVIAFVLGAALAGLLAAVLPGRRAARTSIVESLAAE